MARSPIGPYLVVYTEEQRRLLREWGRQAIRLGMLADYADAVKTLDAKLHTMPIEWGDPQFHHRHLRLLVYHGFSSPLHVYYAVDDSPSHRVVFVQSIHLLPGWGLSFGAH